MPRETTVGAGLRTTVVLLLVLGACETEPAKQAREVIDKASDHVEKTDWKKLERDAQRKLDRAGKQASRDLERARKVAGKEIGRAAKELDQASDKAKDGLNRVSEEVEKVTRYEPIPGADKQVKCRGRTCHIGGELAQKLSENPALLTPEIVVIPRLKAGKVAGLKVSRVPPGSLADLLGFQKGDVLTAINGRPLTSLQQALDIAHDTEIGEDVFLEYERAGKTRKLEIEIDQP